MNAPANQLECVSGRRPSLLLACVSYPPVLGGSEVEAQRVCAALIKRGYEVLVVCGGGSPMPHRASWVDPYGVPVRTFGHTGSQRRRDYIYALGLIWTLLTRRKHYDIVYFLMPGLQVAVGVPVARLLGKAIVMKFSGSSQIGKVTQSALGRLEMASLRRWADRVMVLNAGLMDEAREAGLDPARVVWMPNPVSTDEFRHVDSQTRECLRRELALPADCLATLFVGRLAPEKQLASLLGAFRHVVEQCPDAIVIFVGDGPERAALQARAGELGIEANVRFTGRVNVVDVPKWMQTCDVFTLVSSREGLPCSLLEAMSCGMASVVTDIPANSQLITHGVNGLLVPVGDERAIADALLELFRNSAARTQMGRTARSRVLAGFSTDKVIQSYEGLFSEVLNKPRYTTVSI